MTDHNSDDGEGSGSGGSLTATAAQDTGSPTEREGARGRLPRLPGSKKDVCKPIYSGQPLSRIATETAGTRGEPDD